MGVTLTFKEIEVGEILYFRYNLARLPSYFFFPVVGSGWE